MGNIDTDICVFLSNSLKNGELSGKAKTHANALIERSKTQLQAISKASPPNAEYELGSYMDMGKKQEVIPEYIEPQSIYSPVDETQVDEPTIPNPPPILTPSVSIVEDVTCPYDNLSASEASIDKFGYLDKRERFVVFFQKKVFAAVYNSWLLVYASEKDSKPTEHYYVLSYEAKAASTMKEKSFELMRIGDTSGKTVFFTATTKKDMLQWVAAINRNHIDEEVPSPRPTTPNNTLPKVTKVSRSPYSSLPRKPNDNLPIKPPIKLVIPEIPPEPKTHDDDEDQIYEELKLDLFPSGRKDSVQKDASSPSKLKLVLPPRVPPEPPLPQRNPKKEPSVPANIPPAPSLPTVPNGSDDFDGDLEEYDRIGGGPYSEEDEDCIYDMVVNPAASDIPKAPPATKEVFPPPIEDVIDDDEDVEYDLIHNDPLPPPPPPDPPKEAKPPPPQRETEPNPIKPKPTIKPKLFRKDNNKPKAAPVSPPVVPNRINSRLDDTNGVARQNSSKMNSFVHQFNKRNKSNQQ